MIKNALGDPDETSVTAGSEPSRRLQHPSDYRREIAAALVLKLALLTVLWFLLYRSDGNTRRDPPDIAERLAVPHFRNGTANGSANVGSPSLPSEIQEAAHVRR